MEVERLDQLSDGPADALLRLRVSAEGDPSALSRILHRFQSLNIIPRRVTAEFAAPDRLNIAVDVVGVSERGLSFIAAKIAQMPCVLSAYWHYA